LISLKDLHEEKDDEIIAKFNHLINNPPQPGHDASADMMQFLPQAITNSTSTSPTSASATTDPSSSTPTVASAPATTTAAASTSQPTTGGASAEQLANLRNILSNIQVPSKVTLVIHLSIVIFFFFFFLIQLLMVILNSIR